ncbi:MAG: uracil-DNA glycosylase [Thermodesulfobacteriota bacterium]
MRGLKKGAEGAAISKIRKRIASACRRDPALSESTPVFGDGPVPSGLMVVGEAPGRSETKLGRPFVGRAGTFFFDIVEDVFERPREELYITNVVKVWPKIDTERGRTRPPTRAEIAFFLPYLKEEIVAVGPATIVAVGKVAFTALVPQGEFIPGAWAEYGSGVPVMPVYHPAYILRKQKSLRELTAGLRTALREVKGRLNSS